MAMTPCKECEQPVSSSAKACPNCGASNPSVTAFQLLLGGVVIVGAVVLAVNLFGGPDETPQDKLQRQIQEAWASPQAGDGPTRAAIGDTVEVGAMSYAVVQAWRQSTDQRIAAPEQRSGSAGGEYLFVAFSATNTDERPRSLPPMTLLDAEGAEYEPSALTTPESLNPRVAEQGVVVFHAPVGRGYDLKLRSSALLGASARVVLEPPIAP